MKILFNLFCFISISTTGCSQKTSPYPPGVTIDGSIARRCKEEKELNYFYTTLRLNDSVIKNPLALLGDKPKLAHLVTIRNKDTIISFFGLLVPNGFEIKLNGRDIQVQTFAASKSCRCFKENLSDTLLSYGAGARPVSMTLVLNKRNNIVRGEKIYGYIQTMGGDIFRSRGEDGMFDKWNFEYEGFFEIEFNPGKY
ncbi:MAG: hypothetical protein NTW29_07910 [Bacteroidetes bacterium]|nr:hypothetical protein [Bacteroidota bacterium]